MRARMSKPKSRSGRNRNQSRSNGQANSRDSESGEAERPKVRGSTDSGPRRRKYNRPMPYIVVVAILSFLLLQNPRFTHPFVNPGGPLWLSRATLLIGVIVTWLFARALLAAQIRAVSLGEKFRQDKAVENLIAVAVSRIGLSSLWATIFGLLSLSYGS